MQTARYILEKLRRPALLVQAAHIGLSEYDRDRSLPRLLPGAPGPTTAQDTFNRLADQEAQMDEARRCGDAAYSVARHIEYLIALIVEARLLTRTAT